MGKNRKPKVITSKTFEKPRAKVGKKLKSHTETDTNFKAKKLILLTQLQKSSTGAEPVSRRKLSLAELGNHLSHHNVNVRKDSLMGIKELLAAHLDLVSPNLALLVEKIFPLLHDLDRSVRKCVVAVLTLIFHTTPLGEMRPYLSLLSSNVSCALTHIDEGNQSTGLELIDVILDCYADFVKSHFPLTKSILTITSVAGKSVTSTMGNRQEEETAQSGVSKLLSRKKKLRLLAILDKLLAILASDYQQLSSEDSQLHQPHLAPYLVPIVAEINAESMEKPLANPDNLHFVCRKLIAFLHDVWLDVSSSDSETEQSDLSYTEDQIRMMSKVVKMHVVFLRLFQSTYTEFDAMTKIRLEHELQRQYGKQQLIASYFSEFPKQLRIVTTQGKKSPGQKKEKSNDNCNVNESCVLLNLRLSHLSSTLDSFIFMKSRQANNAVDFSELRDFPRNILATPMRGDLLNYCITVMESQLTSVRLVESVDNKERGYIDALMGCFHRCSNLAKAKMLILEIFWRFLQDDLWEIGQLLSQSTNAKDLCQFLNDSVSNGKVDAVDLASKVMRHVINFSPQSDGRENLAAALSQLCVKGLTAG